MPGPDLSNADVQKTIETIEAPLKTLKVVRVKSFLESYWMMVIRNASREGFAHDTKPIRISDQLAFWRENKDTMVAYVYLDEHDNPVAYAALLLRDGKYWSTNAVHPSARGKGIGKAVLHHVIHNSPNDCDVWAQARKDNPAAVKEHNAVDWEVVNDPNNPNLNLFHTWHGRFVKKFNI
ncbi:Acetyltransferase (GNAT) family protein [uncultured archaeon]|nr:Acetyltransferase (GNAT) family protein [uncultured archaeon]